MTHLAAPVFEVRKNLPEHLNQCLDQANISGYCREWNTAVDTLQTRLSDTRSFVQEALLITQRLNRTYKVDPETRKEINQLLLRSFSGKRASNRANADGMQLKRKPDEQVVPEEEHVFSKFLSAIRDSYDSKTGSEKQFDSDFQARLSSMKISFDTVRVLKNWAAGRGVAANFSEVPAADLRAVVDHLYVLSEIQFGSTEADIILSDAVLSAETAIAPGQLSIRDLL